MIFVSVGTFHSGFDDLLLLVDRLVLKHSLFCVVQRGYSSYIPKYSYSQEFFSRTKMQYFLSHSHVLVSHGGIGIISQGLRHSLNIACYPRITATRSSNSQKQIVEYLSQDYPIHPCYTYSILEEVVLSSLHNPVSYSIPTSNASLIISDFLAKKH